MTSAGRGRGTSRTIVDVARAAGVSRQTVSNASTTPSGSPPPPSSGCTARSSASASARASPPGSCKPEQADGLGFELNPLGVRRLGSILDSFLVELTGRARGIATPTWCPSPPAAHDRRSPATEDLWPPAWSTAFVLADTRHDDPRPAVAAGPATSRSWPSAASGTTRAAPVGGRRRPRRRGDGGRATSARPATTAIGFLGWPAGSPVGDDRRERLAVRGSPTPGGAHADCEASPPGRRPSRPQPPTACSTALGPGGAVVCASDTARAGRRMRAVRERGLDAGASTSASSVSTTATSPTPFG